MSLNRISPLFGTFSEVPSAMRGLVTGAARTQLRLAMQDKPGCVPIAVPSAPTKNLQFSSHFWNWKSNWETIFCLLNQKKKMNEIKFRSADFFLRVFPGTQR